MKTKDLLVAAMLMTGCNAMAQQEIKLPAPDKSITSMSVVEALNTRHSVREYASEALSEQELSNLCWAASGVSRDNDHRTAPSAMNKKEIRLFVFGKDGVYEYDAVANTLTLKAQGDHRSLIAGGKNFKQDFVMEAPVSLLMVIDFDRMGSKDEKSLMFGCVDAGNVSENINLYCQSVGLVTVPRATHDTEGISKLLGLTDMQLPIMNNPVGKPKK